MGGPAYERLQEPVEVPDSAPSSSAQENVPGLSRQDSSDRRSTHNWSRRSSFRQESGLPSLGSRQGSFTHSIAQGGSRRSSHVHLGPLGALQDEYQSRPVTPLNGDQGAPSLAIAGGLISKTHLLTTLQLTGITFFAVAGGPYGLEDSVGAGGALLVFIGLLVLPFMWCAPLAFMTAELACMIPESGGHVLWVYRAFGPFWSFVNSCYAFFYSVLDNALYPVLFVDYLSESLFSPGSISTSASIGAKVAVVMLVTLLNIRGVDIVGSASVIFGVLVLLPFLVMILAGLPQLNFTWLLHPFPATINWGRLITVLLWNLSGFDASGNCAAEVADPSRAYPKALSVTVALVTICYALPTFVGISVLPNVAAWHTGTFATIAEQVGGRWLKVWMGLAAALSALGLLLTRLCTNSRLVYGMSLIRQAPPMFRTLHPRYNTPWAAILLTAACTLFLIGFNFTSLAEADMLFYSLSTVLKFGALVQLRFSEEDAFRPYMIPISTYLLAGLMLVPVSLCVVMAWMASPRAQGIALLGTAVAVLEYIGKEIYRVYWGDIEDEIEELQGEVQDRMQDIRGRIDTVLHVNEIKGRWQRAISRARGMSDVDPNGDGGSPTGAGLKERKSFKQSEIVEEDRRDAPEVVASPVKGARASPDLRVSPAERLSDIKEDPLDEGTDSGGLTPLGKLSDYTPTTVARAGPGASRLQHSSTD